MHILLKLAYPHQLAYLAAVLNLSKKQFHSWCWFTEVSHLGILSVVLHSDIHT